MGSGWWPLSLTLDGLGFGTRWPGVVFNGVLNNILGKFCIFLASQYSM